MDGDVDLSFSEDVESRFTSCHWHYLKVEDGNDISAVERAIEEAKAETEKPTIIEIKTIIGYGASSIQGTSDAHSDPLGKEEVERTKRFYKWEYEEEFFVPEEVYQDFRSIKERGKAKEQEWEATFSEYKKPSRSRLWN